MLPVPGLLLVTDDLRSKEALFPLQPTSPPAAGWNRIHATLNSEDDSRFGPRFSAHARLETRNSIDSARAVWRDGSGTNRGATPASGSGFAKDTHTSGVEVLFDGYLSEVPGVSTNSSAAASIVLQLYLDENLAFLPRLRGSYACAILDARRMQVHVFNDRRGSRPLYLQRQAHGSHGQEISIAPEVATLAARSRSALDPLAVSEFLLVGAQFGNRTLFQGITRFPSASVMTLTPGSFEIHPYWELRVEPSRETGSEADLARRLVELFSRGLSRQLAAVRDPFLFLSGGVDSRVILAVLRELGITVPSVTYGTDRGDDAPLASELARLAGCPSTFLPVSLERLHEDFEHAALHADCRAETVDFPAMPSLLNELGAKFGAFLNGDKPVYCKHVTSRDEALAKVGLTTLDHAPRLADLLVPQVRAASQTALSLLRREALESNADLGPGDLHDKIYLEHRLTNYQNAFTVAKLRHLEPVRPWLDEEVVDFLYRIPVEMRTGKRLARTVLKTIAPDLHDVPFAKSDSIPLATDFRARIPGHQSLKALFERELRTDLQRGLAEIFRTRLLNAYVDSLLDGSRFPIGGGHWWSELPGLWRLSAKRYARDRLNPASLLLRLAQINIYLKHVASSPK